MRPPPEQTKITQRVSIDERISRRVVRRALVNKYQKYVSKSQYIYERGT